MHTIETHAILDFILLKQSYKYATFLHNAHNAGIMTNTQGFSVAYHDS